MTSNQILRQGKAATDLDEKCAEMQMLAQRLKNTVSRPGNQPACDISNAAKISARLRELQVEIDAALVAFL